MTGPRYRISVVGMGFVGLSLAVANASAGFKTIGVDMDAARIDSLKAGKPGFPEPGLDEMMVGSIEKGTIRFTTDICEAVLGSDITFLAVGTSSVNGKGTDISHVRDAVEQIVMSLRGKGSFHLLVVKSTLPPMTAQSVIVPAFGAMIADGKAGVVVNPEFLREGHAIADILRPHLIVVGSDGGVSERMLEEYYADFYETLPEMVKTNMPTAEIIKYANNAFLATKISFINSIGNLCQRIRDADVDVVARAIGKDVRIGSMFLKAGPGFGGSCLPKDLSGLIEASEDAGASSDLFKAVQKVNDTQIKSVIGMVSKQGVLDAGRTAAVLGLAFKSGTDDVRGSVSIRVVEELLGRGLKVKVHDPMALDNFENIFGDRVSYCASARECLRGSDCCVVLVGWDEYRKLTPHDFGQMRSCNVVDAQRILNAKEFDGAGFSAIGLGI